MKLKDLYKALLLVCCLQRTTQQTIIDSFKIPPTQETIQIVQNKWVEVHFGIVYDQSVTENLFELRLHYHLGSCLTEGTTQYFNIYKSSYCPPEVLNRYYTLEDIACERLIVLMEGSDEMDGRTIGLETTCIYYNRSTGVLGTSLQKRFSIQVVNPNASVPITTAMDDTPPLSTSLRLASTTGSLITEKVLTAMLPTSVTMETQTTSNTVLTSVQPMGTADLADSTTSYYTPTPNIGSPGGAGGILSTKDSHITSLSGVALSVVHTLLLVITTVLSAVTCVRQSALRRGVNENETIKNDGVSQANMEDDQNREQERPRANPVHQNRYNEPDLW